MLNRNKIATQKSSQQSPQSLFTPCTTRAGLLERKRSAAANFKKYLPGDFVRKNPWQNN
jgi:hypothetical protein